MNGCLAEGMNGFQNPCKGQGGQQSSVDKEVGWLKLVSCRYATVLEGGIGQRTVQ